MNGIFVAAPCIAKSVPGEFQASREQFITKM
jgi:hypothetical protein